MLYTVMLMSKRILSRGGFISKLSYCNLIMIWFESLNYKLDPNKQWFLDFTLKIKAKETMFS